MPFDADAIRQIFSLETAAAITSATLLLLTLRIWSSIPNLLDRWLLYRQAKAAEKASDWTRLRDENKRLDERCQRLEEEDERCHNELVAVKTRVGELEGMLLGQGKARQEASMIVAIERTQSLKRLDEGGE